MKTRISDVQTMFQPKMKSAPTTLFYALVRKYTERSGPELEGSRAGVYLRYLL